MRNKIQLNQKPSRFYFYSLSTNFKWRIFYFFFNSQYNLLTTRLVLPKRKDNEEKVSKEYSEIKKKLDGYRLFHEIIGRGQFNQWFYALLYIVEFLQIQYFSWHPFLDYFLFKTDFLKKTRNVIQYFQVYFIFEEGKQYKILILLYSCFTILVVAAVLCYIIYKRMQLTKRKLSDFSTSTSSILYILHLFMSLMVTVIPLPMVNIFSAFIQCNEKIYMREFTCFSINHLINLPAAVIGAILLVIFMCTSHIYFTDSNPNSKFPLAQPETLNELMKLGAKVALPYYFVIDPDANLINLYIIFFFFYMAYLLNERFMSPEPFNKLLFSVKIFCEGFTFFTLGIGIVVKYLDNSSNDIGFFYEIIGAPLFFCLFMSGYQFYSNQVTKMTIDQLQNENAKQQYILSYIHLIQNRHIKTKQIALEGMARYHQQSCEHDQCYCKKLKFDELMSKNRDYSDKEIILIEQNWYRFLSSVIDQIICKSHKPFKLHLLNAYILTDKLQNNNRSLLELLTAMSQKPGFQIEYSVYRLQCQIQETNFEKFDVKAESSSKEIDFDKIILFSDTVKIIKQSPPFNVIIIYMKIVRAKEEISRNCVFHMNFWRELMESSPEIKKMEFIGEKINNQSAKIQTVMSELINIYPSNIKVLNLYGHYLHCILNEADTSEKFLEDAQNIKIQLDNKFAIQDTHRIKYGQNSKVALFLCAVKHDEFGVIHNTNKEVIKLTQYQKQELIDQNISKIMPKVYADLHDKFIYDYMVTQQAKVMETDRIVMVLNKNQQLIPCTLYLRILSTLDEGLLIAGFINEIQYKKDMTHQPQENSGYTCLHSSDHFILYRPDIDVVEGISQSFTNKLGISQEEVLKKMQSHYPLSMERIIPDIYHPESVENMLSASGCSMEIDVIQVMFYFLLEEDNEEIEDEDEDESEDFDQRDSNDNSENSDLASVDEDSKEEIVSEEERPLKNRSERRKTTIKGKSKMSSKNSLKSKINRMQKLKVRIRLIQVEEFENKKINLIRISEEDENYDGKTEYNAGDYKRLAKTLAGKSLKHPMSDFAHDMTQTPTRDTKSMNKSHKLGEENLEASNKIDKQGEQQNDGSSSSSNSESNSSHYKQNNLIDSKQALESINEEQLRVLKDFKQRVSERRQPRQVRIMDKLLILVLLGLIALLIADFVNKLKQLEMLDTGVTSIINEYQRGNHMVDVNYYSRKIWAIANGYWSPPSSSTLSAYFLINQDNVNNYCNPKINNSLISFQLGQHVNLLQSSEFAVIKDILGITNYSPNFGSEDDINVTSLMQNGEKVTSSSKFTDSVLTFITGASTLVNTTSTNMQFTDEISSAANSVGSIQKYFFYNKVNGLFAMRNGSEALAGRVTTAYSQSINDYLQNSLVVFIIGMSCVGLSLFALIPSVFHLHKANNKVLSLFGLISIKDIQELVVKVENFQNQFLDMKGNVRRKRNHQLKNNFYGQNMPAEKGKDIFVIQNEDRDSDDEDHEKINIRPDQGPKLGIEEELDMNQPPNSNGNNDSRFFINPKEKAIGTSSALRTYESHNLGNISHPSGNMTPLKSPNKLKIFKNDEEQWDKLDDKINSQMQYATPIATAKSPPQNEKDKKKQKKKRLSEDVQKTKQELLLERSQRIMQSRNQSSLLDAQKLIMVSFIFFGMFLTLYLLQVTNKTNIQNIIAHHSLLQQRNPMLKYLLMFCLEEISTGQQQRFDGNELGEWYADKIEQEEQYIFDSTSQVFPSSFDSYFSSFLSLTNSNICGSLMTQDTDSNNQLSTSECTTVSNQVLQKGIKLAIKHIILNIRNIIHNFEKDPSPTISTYLNSDDYQNTDRLLLYIAGPNDYLRQTFQSSISDYKSSQITISVGLFVSFTLVCLFSAILCWIPFKNSLLTKVWRIKGMLNMIPMHILINDQNLKETINNQDILKAVM